MGEGSQAEKEEQGPGCPMLSPCEALRTNPGLQKHLVTWQWRQPKRERLFPYVQLQDLPDHLESLIVSNTW